MQHRRGHQAKTDSANLLAHHVLGDQNVGDDFRQRPVVADAAGQDEWNLVLDALEHDAALEGAFLDGRLDAAEPADLVDGAQVMLMPFLGGQAAIEPYAEAGAEERLLDVVSRQGVAGKEEIEKAEADQLAAVADR